MVRNEPKVLAALVISLSLVIPQPTFAMRWQSGPDTPSTYSPVVDAATAIRNGRDPVHNVRAMDNDPLHTILPIDPMTPFLALANTLAPQVINSISVPQTIPLTVTPQVDPAPQLAPITVDAPLVSSFQLNGALVLNWAPAIGTDIYYNIYVNGNLVSSTQDNPYANNQYIVRPLLFVPGNTYTYKVEVVQNILGNAYTNSTSLTVTAPPFLQAGGFIQGRIHSLTNVTNPIPGAKIVLHSFPLGCTINTACDRTETVYADVDGNFWGVLTDQRDNPTNLGVTVVAEVFSPDGTTRYGQMTVNSTGVVQGDTVDLGSVMDNLDTTNGGGGDPGGGGGTVQKVGNVTITDSLNYLTQPDMQNLVTNLQQVPSSLLTRLTDIVIRPDSETPASAPQGFEFVNGKIIIYSVPPSQALFPLNSGYMIMNLLEQQQWTTLSSSQQNQYLVWDKQLAALLHQPVPTLNDAQIQFAGVNWYQQILNDSAVASTSDPLFWMAFMEGVSQATKTTAAYLNTSPNGVNLIGQNLPFAYTATQITIGAVQFILQNGAISSIWESGKQIVSGLKVQIPSTIAALLSPLLS